MEKPGLFYKEQCKESKTEAGVTILDKDRPNQPVRRLTGI